MVVLRLLNSTDLDGGVEFVGGSKCYRGRDAYVELGRVPSGSYYILVDLDFDHQNIYSVQYGADICVTNYGAGDASFLGDDSDIHSLEKVLELAFASKVKQKPGALKVSDMAERNAADIVRYECSDAPEGFNFVHVDNRNSSCAYVEEMNFTQFEGIQLLQPASGPSLADVQV